MQRFSDILASLPSVESIERLEIRERDGTLSAVIENRPGSQGSLAVYHSLYLDRDTLDRDAARHALTLFAEHAEDARRHPGRHPNIDRLFDIIERDLHYSLAVVER